MNNSTISDVLFRKDFKFYDLHLALTKNQPFNLDVVLSLCEEYVLLLKDYKNLERSEFSAQEQLDGYQAEVKELERKVDTLEDKIDTLEDFREQLEQSQELVERLKERLEAFMPSWEVDNI